MKLSEKIQFCRKREGLSQEALAEKLGVSRQAVSKWENGDASPELDKIRLLARTFGVSTDWLLSPEGPTEPVSHTKQPDWGDRLHGHLGRLVRRFGWLAGVYIAVTGLGFTFVGGLVRGLVRRMFSGAAVGSFQAAGLPYGMDAGEFEVLIDPSVQAMQEQMLANNPVAVMGTAGMILGIVLITAGILLAIYLKKRSRNQEGTA